MGGPRRRYPFGSVTLGRKTGPCRPWSAAGNRQIGVRPSTPTTRSNRDESWWPRSGGVGKDGTFAHNDPGRPWGRVLAEARPYRAAVIAVGRAVQPCRTLPALATLRGVGGARRGPVTWTDAHPGPGLHRGGQGRGTVARRPRRLRNNTHRSSGRLSEGAVVLSGGVVACPGGGGGRVLGYGPGPDHLRAARSPRRTLDAHLCGWGTRRVGGRSTTS